MGGRGSGNRTNHPSRGGSYSPTGSSASHAKTAKLLGFKTSRTNKASIQKDAKTAAFNKGLTRHKTPSWFK